MENWYDLLMEEVELNDIVAVAINGKLFDSIEDAKEDLKISFEGVFNSSGRPFTAWTKDRVYFPITYDGSDFIGSAPRNPINESTIHMGGG